MKSAVIAVLVATLSVVASASEYGQRYSESVDRVAQIVREAHYANNPGKTPEIQLLNLRLYTLNVYPKLLTRLESEIGLLKSLTPPPCFQETHERVLNMVVLRQYAIRAAYVAYRDVDPGKMEEALTLGKAANDQTAAATVLVKATGSCLRTG
jgi:hypothetical protein